MEVGTVKTSEEAKLERQISFSPPVYRQRYERVHETIIDEKWSEQIKKICDFGCAEFKLFMFLKPISGLNNVSFVDIDVDNLKKYSRRVQPYLIEYLDRRKEPLEVNVFAGSVGDADFRLSNTDAVLAIELIEHLYPDTLDAFPYNIFGFIKPKIAIVTTPNVDFNVVFSLDPKKMRHYDHKFEWTRQQFKEWAENIVCRFPDYSVTLSGIGEGPKGTEHLGECSQMALFVRKDILDDTHVLESSKVACFCPDDSECKLKIFESWSKCKCVCSLCCPIDSLGICTYHSFSTQVSRQQGPEDSRQKDFYGRPYQLIEKVDYPFEIDNKTEEEKLIDEFKYRINYQGNPNGIFYNVDRGRSEIPLVDLIYTPSSFRITEEELSELLIDHGYKIEECPISKKGVMAKCVIHVPEIDTPSDFSDTSSCSSDYSLSNYDPDDSVCTVEENWD